MEKSISELTFKGTVPQAIISSKNQKKIFVVFISGENEESLEMEKTTWTDSKVVESVSKYCVLLHIKQGSVDAMNFSAIYQPNTVPYVTAIGHNGIQLWHSEGFVGPEVLASSLETAWLSLRIQETTATVLTAALASKKLEQTASGPSGISTSEQGRSSDANVQSFSLDKCAESSDAAPSVAPVIVEKDNSHEHTVEDKITNSREETSAESLDSIKSGGVGDEQAISPTVETRELVSTSNVSRDNYIPHCSSSRDEGGSPGQGKIAEKDHSVIRERDSQVLTTESSKVKQDGKADSVDDGKADALSNKKKVSTSSEVHLNIRLPNGATLKEKFSVSNTLRMVKDYVDKNQSSGIGSYDLAVPYPRKVFSDQELSILLSELGLFDRQALIVVPHQKATNYSIGHSSDQASASNSDSSSANDGGYFGFVKRVLSYVNPLSYLSGSAGSSDSGQTQTGMWEYGPNPAFQNNRGSSESPYSGRPSSQSPSAGSRNDGNSRKPSTSRYGSNIHTLKHDEDDDQFNDKNAFWNGNSTQYGGNNDGK